MRGLYRYETAPGRWWACAEEADGKRVNMLRRDYELKAISPPFLELPIGNGNGKKKKAA